MILSNMSDWLTWKYSIILVWLIKSISKMSAVFQWVYWWFIYLFPLFLLLLNLSEFFNAVYISNLFMVYCLVKTVINQDNLVKKMTILSFSSQLILCVIQIPLQKSYVDFALYTSTFCLSQTFFLRYDC